jgi:hypothetical protein
MTYAQLTLPEFDHEMATTRKLLERVPEHLLDWKANEKSNTIGWNACHIAEIPGWAENILSESFFDMNPPAVASIAQCDPRHLRSTCPRRSRGARPRERRAAHGFVATS